MARVLIVDDEAPLRRTLQVTLTGLGCQVTLAEDGVDALGKLEKTRFDLVVTDVRMPRADGFAVLEAAGCTAALSFDRDFEVAGFRRWHPE